MLTPGTLLGERYEIIEKIGAGGMSIVYKARDNRLQRYVAIKELREEFVQDEEFVRKFRKEALSAASLSHPNIVGIYDVGSDHEIHYIVMEYVEGKTLKQLIAEEGPFDSKTVLEFGIQIVSALKHAHSKKIIHRDIKPQNILMTIDGTLKVTDFGIAKAVDSSTIVASGNAIGSVHYFSPEQAKGKFVNESSDLYSCGIVLFEMATKRLPFEADSHISIALKHINEELPKPSSINPNIPENLENLILKATSKNQVDRYQNADEMLRDMRGILNNPDYVVRNDKLAQRTILLSAEETQILRDSDVRMHRNEFQEPSGEEEPVSIYDEDPGLNDNENKEDNDSEVPTFYKVLFSAAGVLVTLALAVVISLACFFWLPNMSKSYAVPDVTNHTLEEAQKMVTANHLKYKVTQKIDDTVEKGTVIDQDPKAGATLRKNGVVELIVAIPEDDTADQDQSGEQADVPDVKNLDTKEAQAAISQAGFIIGDVSFEYSDELESGIVMNQEPAAGTKLEKNGKINLVISKGSRQQEETGATVPNLIGTDVDTAKGQIISSNLSVGKISEEYSDKYSAGTVIRQGLSSGTKVSEGSSVDLTVSKGPKQEEPSEPPKESTPPENEGGNNTTSQGGEANNEAAQKTIAWTVNLPSGIEVKDSYHLVVQLTLDNGTSHVEETNVPASSFPYVVNLVGSGTGVLNVSIDGQGYQENISFK